MFKSLFVVLLFALSGTGIMAQSSSGDPNCDALVTISDAVYLINYIFAGGPAPCAFAQTAGKFILSDPATSVATINLPETEFILKEIMIPPNKVGTSMIIRTIAHLVDNGDPGQQTPILLLKINGLTVVGGSFTGGNDRLPIRVELFGGGSNVNSWTAIDGYVQPVPIDIHSPITVSLYTFTYSPSVQVVSSSLLSVEYDAQ